MSLGVTSRPLCRPRRGEGAPCPFPLKERPPPPRVLRAATRRRVHHIGRKLVAAATELAAAVAKMAAAELAAAKLAATRRSSRRWPRPRRKRRGGAPREDMTRSREGRSFPEVAFARIQCRLRKSCNAAVACSGLGKAMLRGAAPRHLDAAAARRSGPLCIAALPRTHHSQSQPREAPWTGRMPPNIGEFGAPRVFLSFSDQKAH